VTIQKKLHDLGITLPEPAAPVANYVPFVISGNILSISGQIPMQGGKPAFIGIVGDDISMEEACAAAKLCAINLISQMNAACGGNLEKVRRVIKLGGFVNGTNGFAAQPTVINAASDLMVEVFGDKGRHSRSAVGVNGLPLNVPVEIDALVEIG
jgi:enamine deaminase RidA (YjgF/YER057c/UK114 family)